MNRDIVKESRAWAKRVGSDDYEWHGADVLDGIHKVEDLCDYAEAQDERVAELEGCLGELKDRFSMVVGREARPELEDMVDKALANQQEDRC